jgi:microcystin-dependent protein
MSEPFLSEIKIVSFAHTTQGWAFANGQLLPINQNQALFSLLGTTYGGDGQVNFSLPNLRGRVPIHFGGGHDLGEAAGAISHTITQSEMPAHTHFLMASKDNADNINAAGNMFAAFNAGYGPPNNLTALAPASIGNIGGSQPHLNQQPYLTLNFLIALVGIFPSQN